MASAEKPESTTIPEEEVVVTDTDRTEGQAKLDAKLNGMECTIVLAGSAGAGKSTLMNTLLMKKVCFEGRGAAGVTRVAERQEISVDLDGGKKATLVLYDTPGFTGLRSNDEMAARELRSVGSFDLLLLCFPLDADSGRYSPLKIMHVVREVSKIVGEEAMMERAALVLTKCNVFSQAIEKDTPGGGRSKSTSSGKGKSSTSATGRSDSSSSDARSKSASSSSGTEEGGSKNKAESSEPPPSIFQKFLDEWTSLHKEACEEEHIVFLEPLVAGRLEFNSKSKPCEVTDVDGDKAWLNTLWNGICERTPADDRLASLMYKFCVKAHEDPDTPRSVKASYPMPSNAVLSKVALFALGSVAIGLTGGGAIFAVGAYSALASAGAGGVIAGITAGMSSVVSWLWPSKTTKT